MTVDNIALIDALYQIGSIKIEEITLKSGDKSPIYIDLRLVSGHPKLLRQMAEAMWSKITGLQYDQLCGVPLTAIPFAVAISLDHGIPFVMARKEPKKYGTKQLVQGDYSPGEKVLVVEDVITSGTSIMETVCSLRKAGLEVEEAVVFVDRCQQGIENLAKAGIKVQSVLTLTEILERLLAGGVISDEKKDMIQDWLKTTGSFIDLSEDCN